MQDYESLKQQNLRSGSLFKDPEFSASSRLLVDDASQTIFSYFGGGPSFDGSMVEWLRPGVS